MTSAAPDASIAVITNPELRARFESGKAGMVGAVNILGYTAMTAAYRDCDDWLAELTAYLTANRDHVSAVVAERMPKLRLYPAEATYLAWIDGNGLGAPGNDAAAWFLGNARVAFGDGANFGPQGSGFVRMNFGTPRALLNEGLERMARAMASE